MVMEPKTSEKFCLSPFLCLYFISQISLPHSQVKKFYDCSLSLFKLVWVYFLTFRQSFVFCPVSTSSAHLSSVTSEESAHQSLLCFVSVLQFSLLIPPACLCNTGFANVCLQFQQHSTNGMMFICRKSTFPCPPVFVIFDVMFKVAVTAALK